MTWKWRKSKQLFFEAYKTLKRHFNFINKTCTYTTRAVAVFVFLFFQEMKFSGHVCHICWLLAETWRGRCGEVIRGLGNRPGRWLAGSLERVLDVTSHTDRKREKCTSCRGVFNGLSAQTTNNDTRICMPPFTSPRANMQILKCKNRPAQLAWF